MGTELVPKPQMPAVDDLDTEAKRLLDAVACTIGRSAVNHLKDMYPEALKAVAGAAETSLTNHVRNNINYHMRPLIARLVDQKKRGLL